MPTVPRRDYFRGVNPVSRTHNVNGIRPGRGETRRLAGELLDQSERVLNHIRPLEQWQLERATPKTLSPSLEENLRRIKVFLGENADMVFRRFSLGSEPPVPAAIIFVEGLADKDVISRELLRAATFQLRAAPPAAASSPARLRELLKDTVLSVGEVEEAGDIDALSLRVFTGETAFLLDGSDRGLMVNTKGWEDRAVSEPATETVIRGPRDGFTETLRVNTALVRRRIRDPNLRVKGYKVGRRSKTDINVAYIEGIADPEVVDEVNSRLDTIDIDALLESGMMEQLIEGNWLTPFPTILNSERPDEVAAHLLEGRVAIFMDTTPFVLVVPATFDSFFHSSEDHYNRWIVASSLRFLRFSATLIALVAPAVYIAVTSFHPDIIPVKLALAIAATREGVPFPAFLEAFLMEITLELLREAGIRLPGPLGQTIGIVGGVVLGQAAVSAGIASQVMVIVVALTAISSFALPSFDVAISLRLLRFPIMLMAAALGMFGVLLAALAILIHLATLKSFGVWYLAPYAGYRLADFQDTVIRMPLLSTHRRPSFLNPVDADRLDDELRDVTDRKSPETFSPPGGDQEGAR